MRCPHCPETELVPFEWSPTITVELCPSCKGLLLDTEELTPLVGRELHFALPALRDSAPARVLRCPRCVQRPLSPSAIEESNSVHLWTCWACSIYWLEAGTLEKLRRLPRTSRPLLDLPTSSHAAPSQPRPLTPPALEEAPPRAPSLPPFTPPAAHAPPLFPELSRSLTGDRIHFDRGHGNLYGVPAALAFAWLFCSSDIGTFFARLVGMPFHELGHATASWLTSRFAVPLPFFTIWSNDQSWFVGLVVAVALLGFSYFSWREKHPFGLYLGIALFLVQLRLSIFTPAHTSLMLQIASGALGEIFFGALLLIAFHFPLPDRLRWDFWRWPALIPGSICYVQALQLWRTASNDLRHMPWGSALGDDSDGDMNRLISHFDWSARELAHFYLICAWVALLFIAYAWWITWRRLRKSTQINARAADSA